MEVSFVAIVAGEDNYMYLFYLNDIALCIDPRDPVVIVKALGMEFTKQIYTCEEIHCMSEVRRKRKLIFSFTTHWHLDHSGGNAYLKELCPDTQQVSGFEDKVCKCGEKFLAEGIEVECLHTPCHTMDSFCYYINEKYLVTGDTLFFLGCGRFFEGTPLQMIRTIEKIRNRVNHETILLYGHDYNEQDIRFSETLMCVPEEIRKKKFLTLREEIMYNPFFNLKIVGSGREEDLMEALREAKNNFSLR